MLGILCKFYLIYRNRVFQQGSPLKILVRFYIYLLVFDSIVHRQQIVGY